MAADEKWYFTKEQLINTPSRKCGIDADKELSYRQQAANFIQDMGQRLQVSQLCINTAIVYMHRFYVFHSLTQFHRNSISAAAIFLAAKVEEQPRKLEHVIRMAFKCLNKGDIDVKSEMYLEQVQDLVFNENVLLQTLGFDVAIDHPHTHVVKCCYLVKANKDLSQTSYFMASNSLHLTTMCLQYKPTVVACFCIHLACKWSHLEIPQSAEGKNWFWYVDKTVTSELLAQLTGEFLHIFDKCPSKLKRKIRSISANQSPSIHQSSSLLRSPFDSEPRRVMQSSPSIDSDLSFQSNRLMSFDKSEIDGSKKLSSGPSGRTVDLREYREKNRERQEREKAAVTNAALGSSQNVDPSKHHSHHHKQSSSGVPVPSKHSSSSSSAMKQAVHHNHHHHHHHSSRQDVKSSQMMSQRHSTSGSSNSSGGSNSNSNRDPNRERQRMSREYSSSGSYSSHNHSLDNILDASMGSLGADVQTVHPPEKLNNTLPKMHGDLRHSKQQKDMKPYPKFADPTRSRKPDILEQRSEEVRKLIEKPLPPPKPRAEGLKEEYAAMMLKQSHHPSKYGHQAEKPIPSTNMSQASLPTLTGSDSKMLNVGQTAFTTEKSPNAPVSASQISQKSLSSSKTSQAKNGSLSTSATSSFSLVNNLDDVKTDKKPRISDQDNAAVPTPPNKHRSLFSPEKTPTPTPTTTRESSHTQRLKQKQKTPPVVPKQDIHSSFMSPGGVQVTPDSMQQKQKSSNSTSLPLVPSQKQYRLNTETSNNIDQDIKSQVDNSGRRLMGFNMPETVHNSLSNKNVTAAAAVVDTKPKLESFDGTDSLMLAPNQRSKPRSQQQNSSLTNGLHSSLVKQEFSLMDPSSFIVKPELPDQLLSNEIPSDLMYSRSENKVMDFLSFPESVVKTEHTTEPDLSLKQDSFALHKSPQSISALLQEPLAPMPSLLQVPNYEQQPAVVENKLSHQIQQQQQMPPEPLLPSTVDMSELVAPIQCTVDIPAPMTTAASVPVSSAAVVSSASLASSEEKKQEHRSKSEKKKKEKKHKHKEKEKSKEKHKHKHKDKDKEKHHRDKSDREKDKTDEGNSASGSNPGTVPIKITIPKDKLNLSTESIGTSSSTPSSSLKIKIAKERLKGSEVCGQQLQQPQMLQQPQQSVPQPQAPLKIKIRTNEISRSGELQAAANQQQDGTSRKRDRSDGMDGTMVIGAPPTKKPQHQQQQQQPQQQQQQSQRPNERQNGRHSYSNSGSSNKPDRFYEAVDVKTDSGETVEGHPRKYVPLSYGSFPQYQF